jgi:hypothetical protein
MAQIPQLAFGAVLGEHKDNLGLLPPFGDV